MAFNGTSIVHHMSAKCFQKVLGISQHYKINFDSKNNISF